MPSNVSMKLPIVNVPRADPNAVNTKLDPEQMSRSKQSADEINQKHRIEGKKFGESLDKDSFLKLLVTELTHQDPTAPMQDKEFIAQMAQFSSLEQMNNMNKNMQNMSAQNQSTEAYSLLGKRIQSYNPDSGRMIDGTVTSVARRNNEVMLMVGDKPVRMSEVSMVFPAEAAPSGRMPVQNTSPVENTISYQTPPQENSVKTITPAMQSIAAVAAVKDEPEQRKPSAEGSSKPVINQLNNFSNYYDTIKDKAAAAYGEQSIISK